MFPTVPLHYFPPPGVHSFILCWGERKIEEGVWRKKKKKKAAVLGATQAEEEELFWPTQETAAGGTTGL